GARASVGRSRKLGGEARACDVGGWTTGCARRCAAGTECDSAWCASADARELLAGEHLDRTQAPAPAALEYFARMVIGDAADDGGVGTERIRAHDGERLVRAIACDHCDELAFVGDVERVEAEDLAGAAYLVEHGYGGLVDGHADVPGVGELAQGG